jgi:uncharacterized protein (TIGR02996 family)
MSIKERLLHAIYASPEDDTPRLVYADYLLEQADPRGKLIQLQCALSRSKGTERASLSQAIMLILGQNLERFFQEDLGLFQGYSAKGEYERGFLAGARLTIEKYEEVREKIIQLQPPLTRLHLTSNTTGTEPRSSPKLPTLPLLPALKSLGLQDNGSFGLAQHLFQQLRHQTFPKLTSLTLNGPVPRLDELASGPFFPALKNLEIAEFYSATNQEILGLEQLAGLAPSLTGLQEIRFGNLNLLALSELIEALPHSLSSFSLYNCTFSSEALKAFFGRPLKLLSLKICSFPDELPLLLLDNLPELDTLQGISGTPGFKQAQKHPRVKSGEVELS